MTVAEQQTGCRLSITVSFCFSNFLSVLFRIRRNIFVAMSEERPKKPWLLRRVINANNHIFVSEEELKSQTVLVNKLKKSGPVSVRVLFLSLSLRRCLGAVLA